MTKSIAVFSHAHPDFSRGGGERVAYNQHLTQIRIGLNSIFLFPVRSDKSSSHYIKNFKNEVTQYRSHEYGFKVKTFDPLIYNLRNTDFFETIVEIIRRNKIEVLHFHHFWGVSPNLILYLRDKFSDLLFVFSAHEYLSICANDGQMLARHDRSLCNRVNLSKCAICRPEISSYELLDRRKFFIDLLDNFDVIISPSKFLKVILENEGVRSPIKVIENGVDRSLSNSNGNIINYNITSNFAFFGQPTVFKGIDIFVAAAIQCASRGINSARFYIYGCNEDNFISMFGDQARTAINILGKSLVFCGYYSSADVVKLMSQNGYIVVPSIWWENSPLVIQESFLAKRPPIVSNIGGMKEKVKNNVDGIHFNAGNSDDLADKISQLVGNISKWMYLTSNIKMPDTLEKHTSRCIDLFCETLSSNR